MLSLKGRWLYAVIKVHEDIPNNLLGPKKEWSYPGTPGRTLGRR